MSWQCHICGNVYADHISMCPTQHFKSETSTDLPIGVITSIQGNTATIQTGGIAWVKKQKSKMYAYVCVSHGHERYGEIHFSLQNDAHEQDIWKRAPWLDGEIECD